MSDDEKVWVVSLGDGTWVTLTERPILALVTRKYLNEIDEFPHPCTDSDISEQWETHIHLKDMLEHSIWDESFGSVSMLPINDPNASWNQPK